MDRLKQARQAGKMLNFLAAFSTKLAGKSAFRIFCTPRTGRLREKDRVYLEKATKGGFHFEKLLIRTYEWGAQPGAPVVLLVHGWESNSARWQRLVSALVDAGFCVRALDAPGHGDSGGKILNLPLYARTLKAWLEQMDPVYAMVGHSIGGAAVVMSLGWLGAPPPEKAVVMGAFTDTERVVRDFARILGVNEKVWEALNLEIERKSGQPLDAFKIHTQSAKLGHVRGLVMHDRHDEISPIAEGLAIAKAWPGAIFLETAELGHRMQDKSVNKAICKWLKAE